MFSGIGGFELGIQRAFDNEHALISEESKQEERSQGRKRPTNQQGVLLHDRDRSASLCVGYSEIDKYAIKVYERHFKHDNYGDATKINPTDLPDFDLLVGGFPCQAFSIAGKRAGFNDTRGTLFFDIARILKEKQPRHLVLENVKGLLSHDSGRTFTTIIGVLTDLGYLVEWQVLNSKDFGVPQNRERVFIVGHLGNECGRKVFPIIGSSQQTATVAGYISEEVWPRRHEQIRRTYNTDGAMPTIPTGTGGGVMTKVEVRPVLTPDREKKRQNGRRIKNVGEPSFTLTGQDKHGVAIDLTRRADNNHRVRKDNRAATLDANYYKGLANQERPGVKQGTRIRRLTPLECERLQGFPDNWTAGESDTQRYKMCGNAVTVNVVSKVMEQLL